MDKSNRSINDRAITAISEILDNTDDLGVDVVTAKGGATIIDAGVKSEGSFEVGCYLTEICMGSLGKATLGLSNYGDLTLPVVFVETSRPSEALLGSQFAGWKIDVDGYFAMASGPGRALSLKPKKIYEEIQYRDKADHAVIVLESDKLPTEAVLKYIAERCQIPLENLSVLVASTSSIDGSVQISGRIAETGMHRLVTLGLNPRIFKHATGKAPVAPLHPDSNIAMGRTNDVLYYGGETYFIVDAEGVSFQDLVEQAPSSSSKDYGQPFYEIFKAAKYDFYKIDPALFAPAVVTINNMKDGKTFSAGQVNPKVLIKAMGYK